jgi:hypothetical protein
MDITVTFVGTATTPISASGMTLLTDPLVLSHMHGDHWDRVAQRDLDRACRS